MTNLQRGDFLCNLVFCWPGISLVQCWGNLCNIGTAFAAASYYQKINWSKIKIDKKWCCSENNALNFFLYNVAWSLLVITQGFYLCNVVWSLLDTTAQGFYLYLCNVVPRELWQQGKGHQGQRYQGQYYMAFFLCNIVQGALRQQCTGFFFCSILPRVSWETLHKVSTCTMLSQEY